MLAWNVGLKVDQDESWPGKYKLLLKIIEKKLKVSLHNSIKNDVFINPKLTNCMGRRNKEKFLSYRDSLW